MRHLTQNIKCHLQTSLVAALFCIFSLVCRATATPITTANGALPYTLATFYDAMAYGDVLIISEDDTFPAVRESEFIEWTIDVVSPSLDTLSSVLLDLTLTSKYSEFSPDVVNLDTFSGVTDIQDFPFHPTGIVKPNPGKFCDFDSMLGITDLFPMLVYDDTAIPSRQDNIVPDIPIPEPSTILLFVTAFGGMVSYRIWRRRRPGSMQSSVVAARVHLPEQQTQDARITMFGKMAGEVIHDVKNALTAIRTCAEVLGYDDLDPAERQEFLQVIIHEIDRTVEMTQELLDFASGRQKMLNFQPCSVKDFLHDLLPVIEQDFATHQISLQTELHYTGAFEVDIDKMTRVVLNIAANARDAMPEGGTFTITSQLIHGKGARQLGTCQAPLVQFEFIDTGCGMSPDLQAHFLEPFVTEGKSFGTGLGMAIVKDILDAHHAQIEVHRVAAQGTTIRISLPRSGMTGKLENSPYEK